MTTSQPPGAIRRLLLIQLIALACGLGYWAYKMADTWPTLPAPTVTPPGVTSAEFPQQRFTRADLEAYASSARADGALLEVFNMEAHNTAVAIEAALVPPAGSANSAITSYGWPFGIYSQRTSANYSDVYEFANPTSGVVLPRDMWIGWARVRVENDGAGRVWRSAFFPERIVASALVVFCAWLCARLLWLLFARFGPARARGRPLRLAIPLLAAVLAAAAVTALSLKPRIDPPGRWPSMAPVPTTGPTGLTFGDVIALRSNPNGEAQLAAAMLTAADIAEGERRAAGEVAMGLDEGEPVLIYAWRHNRQTEFAHASGGWPNGLSITASGADPLPNAGPDRQRYKLTLKHHAIALVRHNLADPAERTTWSYSLAALTKVAAGLLVLWFALGAIGAVWRAHLRGRDRRRARAGRCIPCGYDLRGSPGA